MADNRPLALVTGASRGIGLAVARKLAENGYDLVMTCSASYDELKNKASEIENNYGVSCFCKVVDAGKPEEVRALFEEEIFSSHGLEVLVNNAGISFVGLFHEMSDDELCRVMSVNATGVMYTSKYAIPFMLKKHAGSIINISSVWGNIGASMEVAYSASKGAVNSFTKALAKELAPSGIKVNAIACGLIDTQMNACFSKEDLEEVIGEIPADRIGKPEEIAEVVLSVARSTNYLTGQIITVDGGWT